MTDVQLVVVHSPIAIRTVDEYSSTPKLNPVTVTEIPAVLPAFNSVYESTGASNVSPSLCVPVTAATVRDKYPSVYASTLFRHASVVEDIHDVVEQSTGKMRAVTVRSLYAKFRPVTVTDDPPLITKLSYD